MSQARMIVGCNAMYDSRYGYAGVLERCAKNKFVNKYRMGAGKKEHSTGADRDISSFSVDGTILMFGQRLKMGAHRKVFFYDAVGKSWNKVEFNEKDMAHVVGEFKRMGVCNG